MKDKFQTEFPFFSPNSAFLIKKIYNSNSDSVGVSVFCESPGIKNILNSLKRFQLMISTYSLLVVKVCEVSSENASTSKEVLEASIAE